MGGLLPTSTAPAADQPSASLSPDNPFSKPSTLPYQLPPFDRIHDADFRPAFEAGMSIQRREVDAIARDAAPPTFENVCVALERSGELLERVEDTFQNLVTSNSDDGILAIEKEMAPRLSAHEDAIYLDAALFARLDAVYRQRAQLSLDGESRQLLERQHTEFLRAGARLSAAGKSRLREINQQLSNLTTQFRQNLLKATRDSAVRVERESELAGLSPAQIGAAAAAARARGLTGWLITLQNTTTQPVLAQLQDRALRERIFRASTTRASSGSTDNRPVVTRIVALRLERARLLGYPTHAAYALEDETAHTPEAVDGMLRQIIAAALARTHQEAIDIQALIDSEAQANHTARFPLQPWDWQFYTEKLQHARYDFDAAATKPYFELDRVLRDGVFYVAHELYGLTFRERHDLPLYRPDVRVFEVFDADGKPLALFLADYFARDSKQGGAWMNSYVTQSKLLGRKPVVVNNLNIAKPVPGQPVLLTFEEVTAMFHEFGHALHGMLSDVRYASLSGTEVARDFVEYPSQYNEMWARDPAVVAHFAYHYQTGEPLPSAVLQRIIAAQNFNQGYLTTEYLEATVIDMAWHEIGSTPTPDAEHTTEFESAALARAALDASNVPPRYHSTYFQHIFAGGYPAAYYAYLWSEVLARDTGQWFHQRGGLTRANGDEFRAKILSRGRTAEPQTLFQDFYGRAPDIRPLLEYRGLTAGAP
jgi:peptidyl-dipeptidase Dcp